MNAGHLKEQQELFTHTSFQPFILLAFFFFSFLRKHVTCPGLKLLILLPPPPNSWGHRLGLSCLVLVCRVLAEGTLSQ